MIEQLTGLGYGIVTFAVVIGVGMFVLYRFGAGVATCSDPLYTYNLSADRCGNSSDAWTTNPTGAWVSTNYLSGTLGSDTGGLATWTPAIIAAVVGFLFLAMFMGRTKNKGKY